MQLEQMAWSAPAAKAASRHLGPTGLLSVIHSLLVCDFDSSTDHFFPSR
jgi:hypothetical protein